MPQTMTDTGKVARPGSEASMVPTMPAVAAITVLLPPANACAIASTTALRLARRSSATKGKISAITDIDKSRREHDPEKWEPVFGQDHAQNKKRGARSTGRPSR